MYVYMKSKQNLIPLYTTNIIINYVCFLKARTLNKLNKTNKNKIDYID